MDRREFLRATTAGLALTAAGSHVPLYAQAKPRRVGLIGSGWYGKSAHFRLLQVEPVEVVAVCDVDKKMLAEAASMIAARQKSGKTPRTYGDYREMLKQEQLDIVHIATPDHWHALPMIAACKAGADVYVEKPVSVDVVEAHAMLAAARKYNRVVQAGTWQRSGAHFQRACEIVASGELGKIAFARSWIYNNQPKKGIGNPAEQAPPPGLDWDLWQGPARQRPFNPNRFGVYNNTYSYFRFFWDYAGGIVTDSGIHMIDIVQMALGDAMPGAVVALGGKYWLEDNSETPDTMQATFEYPGLLGSWEHRTNNTELGKSRLMGINFHGSRGTLYVDRAVMRITAEEGSDLKPFEMKRVADPHPLHWVNFLDCVRTRKRPNSDIETCVKSSITSILGNLSIQAGMRLDWDQQAQTVKQAAARPLLHREYRSPWKLEA